MTVLLDGVPLVRTLEPAGSHLWESVTERSAGAEVAHTLDGGNQRRLTSGARRCGVVRRTGHTSTWPM